MLTCASKTTSTHLPKRLELLLCTVCALPKASRSSPEFNACAVVVALDPDSLARHDSTILAVSVLPAPLSPLMRMDCGVPVALMTV